MTETWYGIQVDVDLPLDVLAKLRHILEHVQFLSISLSRHNLGENVNFRQKTFATFIAGVLSSTPKLTALQMDIRFLRNDLSELWSSPVICDHLRNLESLELIRFGLENHSTKAYNTTNEAYNGGGSREPAFLVPTESARNLLHLATTMTEPCRLKRLRLSKYDVICTVNPGARVRCFSSSFLDLLRSHRASLLEVSITVDVWKASDDDDDIRTVTCPKLKTLIAVVDPDGRANFESFLVNHPNLEELDIAVVDGSASVDKDMDLWEAIKRGCTAPGAA